jgi:small nuclear ribonucleoprotein
LEKVNIIGSYYSSLTGGSYMSDMPIKILENSLGKIVLVKLKGDKRIRGRLEGYDQHMNLFLEDAEEVLSNGEVKSLGPIILRGDNVVIISPAS